MNIENHYETLGVQETASQEDIKKKYRKLAKENHPDAGGNEELFKKISTAYDVLSDQQKRKQYDHQRQNPFSQGFNVNDMFGSMFNQRNNQPPVHTTNITVSIGVLSSYNAGKHTLNYRRQGKCEPCNGSGGQKKTCNVCNGSGSVVRQFGNGMFVQVVQTACESCSGRGFHFVEKCFVCNGNSSTTEIKNVDINIPHGIDNGQFLRLSGMGDFRNGNYGDLIVRIELKPENNFTKLNNNLIYDAFLTLEDIKNGSINIPHPDGSLNIKLPKNFDTSIPLRVKLKGYRLETVGDLIVNQYVKFKRD